MKKIAAMMLALIMVLSMASVAMAGETTQSYIKGTETAWDATKATSFTFDKKITADGADAEIPAQSVTFEQVGTTAKTFEKLNDAGKEVVSVGDDITGAPSLTLSAASFIKGQTDASAVTVTTSGAFPQTGVYTYFFKEIDGNIAGEVYTYDGDATTQPDEKYFAVKITVVNNPEAATDDTAPKLIIGGVAIREAKKEDTSYSIDYSAEKLGEIENTYEAGSLKVSKTVTGNLGDKSKKWNFTVVFTAGTTGAAQDDVKSEIKFTGSATDVAATGATVGTGVITPAEAGWKTATVTFKLTDSQDITFSNIPAGVTYTVMESEAGMDGYTTTVTASDTIETESTSGKDAVATAAQVSGTISGKTDKDTADYTNDKNIPVDTGVSVTVVPYIMILAVAMMGAAMMITRRRKEEV